MPIVRFDSSMSVMAGAGESLLDATVEESLHSILLVAAACLCVSANVLNIVCL